MSANSAAERRSYQRHPLATSVSFYHEESRKDYPGRCVDISHNGLLMYVPAPTPVQVGHTLRLRLGGINRPEFANLSEMTVEAVVTRVERHTLLSMGTIAVGVRFANV